MTPFPGPARAGTRGSVPAVGLNGLLLGGLVAALLLAAGAAASSGILLAAGLVVLLTASHAARRHSRAVLIYGTGSRAPAQRGSDDREDDREVERAVPQQRPTATSPRSDVARRA